MKHLFFSLIICSLFCCSCTQSKKHELTNDEKQQIISEVATQWKISCDGIEQKDAQKAYSVFSSDDGTKYLREIHLFASIEEAEKQYADWFRISNPRNLKLSFNPIIYDVLSPDFVLITAIGTLVYLDSVDTEIETIIGYTVLWQKEEEGWKIINMHTSL